MKARIMAAWVSAERSDLQLLIPELPYSPELAMKRLIANYFNNSHDYPAGIVGSSLGGYYALYLSVRFGVRAALVNPALKPFVLLNDYLGENTNLYTGVSYRLNTGHMDELLALQVDPSKLNKSQVLTLLQVGDATLNYREALTILHGQPMWIIPDGCHEFEEFERVIPSIIGHFGV